MKDSFCSMCGRPRSDGVSFCGECGHQFDARRTESGVRGDRFVVVDVETANADMASICQIGIVSFSSGQIEETWESLVNPEDYFDFMNVSIHGIKERDVRHAPKFPAVAGEIGARLSGQIVASHMSFDRVALTQAHQKHGLPPFECEWLDTAKVCRRAWSQFAQKGYGLKPVASWCGIEFGHHDAAEDARAAGLILLKAVEDTGLTVEQWLKRSRQPIHPGTSGKISRQGDASGPLLGEQVVFTGELSMRRADAAEMAAKAGCDVKPSVGKKTTLLVVGDQDIQKLGGAEKSSKQRKADELIAAGQPIRIMAESDFISLVHLD